MGAVQRLSEEEKAERRLILSELQQWKEETGSDSLVRYASEKGLSYPYLKKITCWARTIDYRTKAMRQAPAHGQGFTKVSAVPFVSTPAGGGAVVRIKVGSVSVEVEEGSSRANLAKVLSVLGVGHVPGL